MQAAEIQETIKPIVLYPRSVRELATETLALARDGGQQYLIIVHHPGMPAEVRDSFSGDTQPLRDDLAIKWCLPSNSNAKKLRQLLPWTAPQPLGLHRSYGAGDRLGLAGAAHIQAARDCPTRLVLAQQSIREMTRTARTPDQVLDAATWAAFQEGYEVPWGADADHLKTPDDIERLAAAGFTFFTIDPSAHVDDNAGSYSTEELQRQYEALEQHADFTRRYAEQSFALEGGGTVKFSTAALQQAAVKYARAVEHTCQLAALLEEIKGAGTFDLEMSVDETASPTSVEEHYFVANELQLRGVRVQSLALRFIGEFQKGVDYRGDLGEFEARLLEHFAILQTLGPYKMSIHSGSDKFSVFPIIARVCGELIHEKTAGTWYLEALRVAARCDTPLFREILEFSEERFSTDRASYHVVENLEGLPPYRSLPDEQLESLLDNDIGRQMLHVTFGSVLTSHNAQGGWLFRDRLYMLWQNKEPLHHEIIAAHSRRHLEALGMCGAA